jgi:hypothetical protein
MENARIRYARVCETHPRAKSVGHMSIKVKDGDAQTTAQTQISKHTDALQGKLSPEAMAALQSISTPNGTKRRSACSAITDSILVLAKLPVCRVGTGSW